MEICRWSGGACGEDGNFHSLIRKQGEPATGVDYLDNLAPQALEIKHEVLISTHVESFAGLGNHMNLDSKTRERFVLEGFVKFDAVLTLGLLYAPRKRLPHMGHDPSKGERLDRFEIKRG